MKKSNLKKFICIMLSVISLSLNISGCIGSTSSKNMIENSDDNKIKEVDNLNEAPFEVTFMDVGKADCILIKIEDKSIMIDTGLNKTKDDVVSQLQDKGIDELDYLILTHMDKDHIGGADAVLDNFKVDNLIQADYIKDSKQYTQYVEAVEKNNIKTVSLHENINVQINNAEINIYAPVQSTYSKSNDYSIIVGITYGRYSFLFAGDAEEERLAEFININNKKYNVVKIPHHGRINVLSEEFIKSISPSYSIITCSEEDKPDEEMIDLLNKYKIKTFLTIDGEIIIKTDGNSINISQ